MIWPGSRRFRPAGWVLLVAGIAVTAPVSAAEPIRCLPAEAGATLARLYEDGTLARLAPPGTALDNANIRKVELEVDYRDSAGGQVGVVMAAGGSGSGDSAGRWFDHVPYDRRGPLTEGTRQAMLAVAQAIDGAFDSNPWIECRAAPVHPGARGTRTTAASPSPASATESPVFGSALLLYPRWLFLMLGALALVWIGLGWWVGLSRPKPPPDRPPSESP